MYVRVCVFGKEQQNRTAVPGSSWQRRHEDQTEMSMQKREGGEGGEYFHLQLQAADLLLPVVPLQVHVDGLALGGVTAVEESEETMKKMKMKQEPARITVLMDYKERGEDYSRLFPFFHPSVGTLRAGEHLIYLKDTCPPPPPATLPPPFTCRDYYLRDTWAELHTATVTAVLQVRSFGVTVWLIV